MTGVAPVTRGCEQKQNALADILLSGSAKKVCASTRAGAATFSASSAPAR
jgi:hypothetical protein